MPDENKTTLHLPTASQATVTGPADVDAAPGSSITMAGWYRSFEKYGFAGLVAFLFGWLIFNQANNYNRLTDQRERDMEAHAQEVEDAQKIYREDLRDMRTRYDDVRREFRDNHIAILKALEGVREEVNRLRWNAKGKLE